MLPEEEEKQPAYMKDSYKQKIKIDNSNNGSYFASSGYRNYPTSKDIVTVSKSLSKILRHDAGKFNIRIGSDGFCDLQEIFDKYFPKRLGKMPTLADIQAVVEDNNKKRFELVQVSDSKWKIRAV